MGLPGPRLRRGRNPAVGWDTPPVRQPWSPVRIGSLLGEPDEWIRKADNLPTPE